MRRRNTDEETLALRRRVAAGDDKAVFELARALGRVGIHDPEEASAREMLARARQDAERIVRDAREAEKHQNYANYETFTVAVTLENDGRFMEWAERVASTIWDSASEEERRHEEGSYSAVIVRFANAIEAAVEGSAPERIALAPRNLSNLSEVDPELEQAARPWPRDRELLGSIYVTLLSEALRKVDWREIAEDWLPRLVPESA